MAHDLLERLKNNDKRALKELFNGYYTGLTRFALGHVADQMVAEEIVQDIFIYLWEKRTSLQIVSLESYLYQSVKNKCINYVKSKAHRADKITDSSESLNDLPITTNDVETKELAALIEKVLGALPPQTAMIFTFSRNVGLTYPEIAKKLNISQKTVEYHVSSALRILKEVLHRHGYLIPVMFSFFKV